MGSACFVKSATKPDDFPKDRRPEVVFCGRSNVGKSSLLNTLTETHGLARTSSSPGRTQTINFFLVDDRIYFVDIPGYGYARAPAAIRSGFPRMVEGYLSGREDLKLAILLVDSRHKPMESDLQMKSWLDFHHIPTAVILTKADKINRSELNRALRRSAAEFNTEDVLPFSAVTRLGKKEILQRIREAVTRPANEKSHL